MRPAENMTRTGSGKAVLLVGPSWVGDMVMAQSLIQVLKDQDPGRPVDVLAPGWSLDLLERMPGVREALCMPVGHGVLELRARLSLGRGLRGRHGQAIVLPNSFKSALTPFFARIPRRTGYTGEWRFGLINDRRRLDKTLLPMTVQRFVALALPGHARKAPEYPLPRLRVDPEDVSAVVAALGLRLDLPALVICPGAEYGPAKRWPAANFARVAGIMRDRGWQVWVMGSARDRQAAGEVCALAGPGCLNLAGSTTLAQAVDLMAQASAVVCNDSGLMHVAAALGRPLVAVYGSSDPGFTPPLGKTARIASLGLACSPCFRRECPLGHLDCLRDLHPEKVLEMLDTLGVAEQTRQSATLFSEGAPDP